jgi:hypothetical protein
MLRVPDNGFVFLPFLWVLRLHVTRTGFVMPD